MQVQLCAACWACDRLSCAFVSRTTLTETADRYSPLLSKLGQRRRRVRERTALIASRMFDDRDLGRFAVRQAAESCRDSDFCSKLSRCCPPAAHAASIVSHMPVQQLDRQPTTYR